MRGLTVLALTAWCTAAAILAARSGSGQGLLHEHPAVGYAPLAMAAVVEETNRRLASGTHAFDPRRGYLSAALAALEVSPTSQLMLFSRTGVQQALTSPRNPRAFYFNDRVVIGHVPGAPFLEMALLDSAGGARFYTLSQDRRATMPAFAPSDECLRCHVSSNTLEVPGFIARSMYTDTDGRTHPNLGSFLVDHRRDYAERWGGWFVTGAPDTLRHLGNTVVTDPAVAPTASVSEVPSLEGRAPTERYLSVYSDVTALAVFDHQMHAMNLLTRLAWEARVAAGEPSEALDRLAREAADYLLFVDEAPLDGPITGGSGYAEWFSAQGPRDAAGRSLREFDRRTRLFRYPASYMIYSPAVDAMAVPARDALFRRMREVLDGRDPDPRYGRMAAADRQAALEILRETRAGWPR